jgi:hypothetical protein
MIMIMMMKTCGAYTEQPFFFKGLSDGKILVYTLMVGLASFSSVHPGKMPEQ